MIGWAGLAVVAAIIFLALRKEDDAGKGGGVAKYSVDLEVPTVRGPGTVKDGTDYAVSPTDPEMQRLIDESTAAIEAAGGYPT